MASGRPRFALWRRVPSACAKADCKSSFSAITPFAMPASASGTRTAVRKQVTSFGTFLSTLCHEFCHHLDCQKFGFGQSPHTRGFYERTALLYHHARGTPSKRLFWIEMPRGRWRIDWQRMNSVQRTADQIVRFSSRSYSGK
jgi:hypothetical protein